MTIRNALSQGHRWGTLRNYTFWVWLELWSFTELFSVWCAPPVHTAAMFCCAWRFAANAGYKKCLLACTFDDKKDDFSKCLVPRCSSERSTCYTWFWSVSSPGSLVRSLRMKLLYLHLLSLVQTVTPWYWHPEVRNWMPGWSKSGLDDS